MNINKPILKRICRKFYEAGLGEEVSDEEFDEIFEDIQG